MLQINFHPLGRIHPVNLCKTAYDFSIAESGVASHQQKPTSVGSSSSI
jgi:hypothetical protein